MVVLGLVSTTSASQSVLQISPPLVCLVEFYHTNAPRANVAILHQVYSLDDTVGDIAFSSFSIKQIPPYVFNVLHDILAVNRYVKVHLVPWSPVRLFLFDRYICYLTLRVARVDEIRWYDERWIPQA